jgi:hypothetical protein
MTIKQDSIIGQILGSLKRKPEIIALLLVVGSFQFQMDRMQQSSERKELAAIEATKDSGIRADAAALAHSVRADAAALANEIRADKVAAQRITTCHDVQVHSIDAMKRNTEALLIHSGSNIELSEEIETLTITVIGLRVDVDGMSDRIQELFNAVSSHEKFTLIRNQNETKF